VDTYGDWASVVNAFRVGQGGGGAEYMAFANGVRLDPIIWRQALLESGELIEALKSFRKTLDLDPKNTQARASMALAEKKLEMSRR
jgi:hypothetical protein